jgi:single-strand DNA-binding protein
METESRNEVLLLGRLSAQPVERVMPSGDVLVTFRVVVDRPPSRRAAATGRASTVDALECVVWTAALRRAALSWQPADVLELEGALRRRFWRAQGGATSRYEIEVSRARRVAKAA